MPWSVSEFKPRLSTVSIIPGMENLAPERTETNKGFVGSPNFLPLSFSAFFIAASVCSHIPLGNLPPAAVDALHASVVMVKPGGTGSLARVISARPAPLPPSRSRISLLPSLNKYTHFLAAGLLAAGAAFPPRWRPRSFATDFFAFAATCFAIRRSSY